MHRSRVRPLLVLFAALMLVALSSCRKNHPPDLPGPLAGPDVCYRDTTYNFTATAIDPEGDSVAVRVDWGDSAVTDWTDWAASGDVITVTHAWSDTGSYEVVYQARDQKLAVSDWSGALSVRVVPRPPDVPSGPDTCFKDTNYAFTTVATDRYGDSVAIRFAWGDGDTSDWSSYVAPGESVTMTHAWAAVGTYGVTAQARDLQLHGSGWSGAHAVQVVLRLPPNPPETPTGPGEGEQDTSYAFTAVATHPEDIAVAVRFDWGDGDTSDWGAYVGSGEPTTMSHAWSAYGVYRVKAQAKDIGNVQSQWSLPHEIVIEPADTLRIWRYQLMAGTADNLYSSPAIGSDGTVYVGSQDNHVYAIDPDGTLKWRYQTGGVVRASPAIAADGTVYVGSYDNLFYAIRPDGTLEWNYTTAINIPSSAAIAADGTVYFGSGDEHIYALNPGGTLRWRKRTGRVVYSSPAVGADGTVYCGSYDNFLYALNPDSTVKWSYQTNGDVHSSPAVGADGTVYVGSNDDYLYAFNPDGTLKWSYRTGDAIRSSPAVGADGTVYVGSQDNYVYAINPDGTLKWQYATGEDVIGSPAVSSDGTVYIGSDDNYLHAVNPDGVLIWRYETSGDIESSPAIGPDGTVYFTSYDGYLYALKGTGTLADSSWPKFRHDLRNTGRVGGGR
jgi:outer membrane protein assembly factor BamB